MAIRDLFKSESERRREREKKRRRAIRGAERIVDEVKTDVAQMKKERDQSWQEAKECLANSQKAASLRSLQAFRAIELEIDKLERRRWTFEQIGRKLKNAAIDLRIGDALGEMAKAVEIDPDLLEERLGDADDKLIDLVDSDKVWESAYRREMQGVETKETEVIPTLKELEKQLEDEVVAELQAGKRAPQAPETDPEMARKISEGRKRLKGLLEGEK